MAARLPQYVISALRKGLKLYAEGHAGDGLQPSTLRAARTAISTGQWPDAKVIKASAWFARHVADRARMRNPRAWNDPPDYSPAYVAWLLWGSDADDKGRRWIDKTAKKLKTKSVREARIGPLKVSVEKTEDGNRYSIDGRIAPGLSVSAGDKVIMDVSHPSNAGHPIRFSETGDGTHGGGEEISAGVSVRGEPGQDGASVELDVGAGADSRIYYYCTKHPGMGSSITVRKPRKEAVGDRVSATPAPPEDRIKGGKNTGRASGSAKANLELSKATNAGLEKKMKDHNEKHGARRGKRVTLRMLQKVYLRGAGAFSRSHRPGMTRGQWAYARVNSFLELVRTGKPKDEKYVTDNDLLPSGHPRKSRSRRRETMNTTENKHYDMKERVLKALMMDMGGIINMMDQVDKDDLGDILRSTYERYMKICGYDDGGHHKDDHGDPDERINYRRRRYASTASDPQMDPEERINYRRRRAVSMGSAVDNPTAAQRADLPAEAYEPAAFFNEDGDFLSSKSKLPHHIRSVTDPNDNGTVDVGRLRNALARFNQVDWSGLPEDTKTKTRAHLEMHADAILASRREDGSCGACGTEECHSEAVTLDALERALNQIRRGRS